VREGGGGVHFICSPVISFLITVFFFALLLCCFVLLLMDKICIN
jgi:hypothetical protein